MNRSVRVDRVNYFFGSMKNIGFAVLLWGIIAFGALEVWGCTYVNWIQKDPNTPVNPPSVEQARYQVYVKANNRYLYSDKVAQEGTIITLSGYYVLVGNTFRYAKGELSLDENYFGDIEFKKR